jgi:signal transduction histidine kinase
MSVETKKRGMPVRPTWPEDAKFPWIGFPGHLSQVLVNFIQNALRYAYADDASAGVDITISRIGETYRVDFADHGQGVPEGIYPRMFEPFVTSGRGTGGSGLGLAIAQNITTNLLHGKLSCTTAQGKGTTMTVLLPLSSGDPSAPAA